MGGDYLNVGQSGTQVEQTESQDEFYQRVAEEYGAALARMAYAYEADPDLRRDLSQEIHLALWRSLGKFNGRCSIRTWIYRVAHNVATSHVVKQSKTKGMHLPFKPWKRPRLRLVTRTWKSPRTATRRSHVCSRSSSASILSIAR